MKSEVRVSIHRHSLGTIVVAVVVFVVVVLIVEIKSKSYESPALAHTDLFAYIRLYH